MTSDQVFYLILLAAVVTVYYSRKLTLAGAIVGGGIALALYTAMSFIGVILLAVFFLLGTAATSHKKELKRKLVAVYDEEKRDAFQVLANGLCPALFALMMIALPEYRLLLSVMVAGAISAATSDTLSSELGNVYGRRFVNIVTFRSDLRGLDGVISLEGCLAGAAGSLIIAVFYVAFSIDIAALMAVFLGGIGGNVVDSWLGAKLERKQLIRNNVVNFLNTLTGGLFAGIVLSLF